MTHSAENDATVAPDCIFEPPGDCISETTGVGCEACTPQFHVEAVITDAERKALGIRDGNCGCCVIVDSIGLREVLAARTRVTPPAMTDKKG